MKNLDIVGVANAYTMQRQSGNTIKLPAAVAWKRRVNMDKIVHANQLIQEALQEIKTRYSDDEHSEAIEGKSGRKVKDNYLPEFFREQTEILQQETDIDIVKVNINDLGDIELSDADMDTLAFMIDGGM